MTLQLRAFGISFAVHAAAFILIVAAGMITPQRKAVVLDFSLGNSPQAGQERAASMRRQAPAAQQQTVTPLVKDEQAAPIRKEQTDEPVKPASDQPTAGTAATAGSDAGTSSTGSAEEAKGRYLGAHFIYIRDKIFRNLSYPALARRMGWTGKVTVAFTVCTDGTVEDISIAESSGFAALDKSAIEAVKRSCPLPRPPLKTALIMPVVYRLE